MTALLYRDAGQTTTVGNVPILLPLGSAVGGTTLVNSGTCFRTPEPVLEHCGARSSASRQLTPAELDPYFRRVERELNVAQVPPELAGRNALVVKRGADALGWSGDFIYRNAKRLRRLAACAPSAARPRPSSTPASPTCRAPGTPARPPDAAAARGAIVIEGGRARGVEATTAGGGTLTRRAPTP